MARKRWVQIDGELVEVGSDYVGEHMHHGRVHGDLHYDGLRATDGTPIDTRTKHREYMKKHGLTTADDFKGEWSKTSQQRAEFYQKAPDPNRPRDIAAAIEKVRKGHRPTRHHLD
jgi:hypothetical protein